MNYHTLALLFAFVTFALAGSNIKVGLYPFIPDPAGDNFATLDAWVSSTFSAANPDIQLNLVPTSHQFTIYANQTILRDLNGQHYDVLQIDSMFLQWAVDNNLIASLSPTDVDTSNWTPQAIQAGTVYGQLYAQPMWHCGYYTFTRDANTANAETAQQLISALNNLPATPQKWSTSWDQFDLPVVYLAGVAQNAYANHQDAQAAVNAASRQTAPIQSQVTSVLATLTDDCVNATGYNPCPYYDYSASYVEFNGFAESRIQSFMYYSEELNPVARADPHGLNDVLFSVTPLGAGQYPFLTYTDVTVISQQCFRRAGCFDAAKKFAAFTWSDPFYNYVLNSQDAVTPTNPNPPLRYLMPATLSSFNQVPQSDAFYKTIQNALLGNHPQIPPSVIIPNDMSYQAPDLYKQLNCVVNGLGC